MKTIAIIADDRVGLLADISYLLGKAKINIELISVDVVGGKAVIILTLGDAEKAKDVLKKSGYRVTEANAILIKLEDKPGELSKVTSALAEKKVNIESVHMVSRGEGMSVLALVVDKPKKAQKILANYLMGKDERGR